MRDIVRINAALLKADAKRMGTTLDKIGASMGKSPSYVSTVISKGTCERETLEAIERAMFQEPGAYALDKAVDVTTPANAESLAQMATLINSALLELREMRKETNELLQKIADKEISTNTYTARMYEHVRNISAELK